MTDCLHCGAGQAAPHGSNCVVGRKDDANKEPWHLVPWEAMHDVVRTLGFGARKYGEDNWRDVPDAKKRYFAAAHRHMVTWWLGENRDPETGLPHLAHAACCILFLLALEKSAP